MKKINKTKRCTKCNVRKYLKYFPLHKKTKDGYCSWCRKCHDKATGKSKAKLTPEERRKRQRISARKNPMTARIADWKRQGIPITKEEFIEIHTKQKGKCAICGNHEDTLDKKLSVDHCHNFVKVRGLICRNCNLLLGNCRDNISILRGAIKYLKKNNG